MNHSTKELRFTTADLEIRYAGGQRPVIRGYASVFNSPSQDLGGFREIVSPGAFRDSLARNDDVVATFNHSADKILGRRCAGTLRLSEDTRGLQFEVSPPDTTYARDLAASMQRGDIKGSSFGFIVNGKGGQRWERKDGQQFRYLLSVRLLDVSVVTEPAYPDASAALRSLAAHRAELQRSHAAPSRLDDAWMRLARARLRRLT